MRGDSLRDLYAKTLALLGLGVLAGIGALVDYWPASVSFPQAGRIAMRPTGPDPLPVRAIDVPVRLAPVQRAAISRRTDAANPTPAADATAVAADADIPLPPAPPVSTHTVLLTPVAAVDLSAPPPPAFVAPVVVADVPAAVVALGMPEPAGLTPGFAAHGGGSGDAGDGLLSSATDAAATFARKAGSSIVTGGSKAGASIVDGLTFVGRSLRKLKFF